MLKHTKRIKKIYEEIQRIIFYIIPEKWDKIFLYASVIELPNKETTGELFFYYIPKGIFKKNPVNGYEIPNIFNLDEEEYLKMVDSLYNKIKELREEFKKNSFVPDIWSSVTMSIQSLKFRVEYDYENLQNSELSSYDRHVIWRVKFLGITPEQCSKEEKEIVRKYAMGAKTLPKKEIYETGVYVRKIEKTIGYSTIKNDGASEEEKIDNEKKVRKSKNQILSSTHFQA